jgi:hypothetical protein
MTTNDFKFLNIRYIKKGELLTDTLCSSNGVLTDSKVAIEIDCSDYICLPGFINSAGENMVFVFD